jgi:hypothetical protein
MIISSEDTEAAGKVDAVAVGRDSGVDSDCVGDVVVGVI